MNTPRSISALVAFRKTLISQSNITTKKKPRRSASTKIASMPKINRSFDDLQRPLDFLDCGGAPKCGVLHNHGV